MAKDFQNAPEFVKVGRSDKLDAFDAVRAATRDMVPRETCFVLAFVPNTLKAIDVAEHLSGALNGVPVFGCTTAGQITSEGYESEALLVLAFSKKRFRCASLLIDDLRPLAETQVAERAQRLVERFRHTPNWNRLALLLTDGLSKQEDILISVLETVLQDLPIFGGSAGDGFEFKQTFVFQNGQAHTNAAVLLLIETDLEFQGLGFDHFLPEGKQVIITESDPNERLVQEINGAPAAQEYARLVGCKVDELSPEVFAENPMLLQHHGRHYVRAINEASAQDNSLSFLAAIDDGLVLTLGRGREIIATLEAGLSVRNHKNSEPDFILAFDCALRRLEFEQKNMTQDVSNVLRERRVFGFNTYGEQQQGVHMNQTFVGVAFFEPEKRTLA